MCLYAARSKKIGGASFDKISDYTTSSIPDVYFLYLDWMMESNIDYYCGDYGSTSRGYNGVQYDKPMEEQEIIATIVVAPYPPETPAIEDEDEDEDDDPINFAQLIKFLDEFNHICTNCTV